MNLSQLRRAMRETDPAMSAFDPLSRILFHDDFDAGLNGWTLMTGNYERSLGTLLPQQRDFRPPMLSNLTMWDTGSAGSLHGSYAMKLATRPVPGSISVGIKRMTFTEPVPIRLEAWFTVKPEASRMRLAEHDVRSFGVFLDLQDNAERVMPHLRYANATGGAGERKWQYKRDRPATTELSGETRTHFHLGPDGWLDVPGGGQRLCYNELPTKQNWHYLRVGFDLVTRRFTELRCNDRVLPHGELAPIRMPAWPNLWQMLNVGFWVESDVDNRSFLYLDSVLLSVERETS
ncbi:DUF6772 family protein [Sciscionella marina]|uniref:DUF6772 family protein n=1 Tax=Sciscionella marina TaxID=508770 RepID=UPI0003AA72B9|nr:DUF6772 family protein [Sciscionella marina]